MCEYCELKKQPLSKIKHGKAKNEDEGLGIMRLIQFHEEFFIQIIGSYKHEEMWFKTHICFNCGRSLKGESE